MYRIFLSRWQYDYMVTWYPAIMRMDYLAFDRVWSVDGVTCSTMDLVAYAGFKSRVPGVS